MKQRIFKDRSFPGSRFLLVFSALLILNGFVATAQESQEKLMLFPLQDVQLKKSPFKNAMLVDMDYMLELDPDRLLAPFLREAGLKPKAESYTNWENTGLDGHTAGHYLTALSLMYASTRNEEASARLDYMLEELKKVQQANGNGYIGGVPGSKKLWQEIAKGEINAGSFSLNDKWVPLYNIHKTYAGLRDAYQIAGREKAKPMLVAFTDWMLEVTSKLSEEQIQKLLISEHGGLNEVFADVAEITGDQKYLDLAYSFSQKTLLEPLEKERDVLNGMHANTQIPKVIGFEAIASLDQNKDYHEAAKYFWDNVVKKRTVAIGGNSVREHFNPTDDFSTMISDVQGPETCNTYNMLKLSKKLFLAEADEKYIDFYEQGLYNHILSSQHPEKGGFVYFTPMRPGHYRVYSQPETSFWCCVGSGIENHGKYNELIYAHTENDLFVNLFIPSTLNWEEKGLKLTQETAFPEEETTSFLIHTKAPQQLNLKLRYPRWVSPGELEIHVNGEPIKINIAPGNYISLSRNWKDGDRVDIKLPIHLTSESLPDGSNYKALKYGPLILAAKTGNEDMEGLFADASRGGHIAAGKTIPLTEMPYFLSDKTENIENLVKKVPGKKLTFSAAEVLYPAGYRDLEFIPFYKVHESRYVMYLPLETIKGIKEIKEKLKQQEKEEKILAAMTIDKVFPGEQQPEADHFIKSENSNMGVNQDRHWRDATGWFSYVLQDQKSEAEELRVTYYGTDRNRKFKILIEGIIIAEENFKDDKGDIFYTKEYLLPKKLMKQHRKELTIRFEAAEGSSTAGIYGVRLMKTEKK
ncbi:glycoside hydrolase family 127 protein [Gramella sp. AN32]|uniref:Beta-L-arabinofuranosidase domain-containing protein n=1 Tax=Christiangramia antarctica TaxID=2058158 RepID=A0ABW5X974_9FLAO|nr:glycoside hydrolase family 127 protein [Gramella sp. AN32]MCM4157297.1 glycosyl hydrolase [Gramella sp. AN32]